MRNIGKNWSKNQMLLYSLILPGLIGFSILATYSLAVLQIDYINSLNDQKMQLERLIELDPDNLLWHAQLAFVNSQLEAMKTTK